MASMGGLFAYRLVGYKKEGYIQNMPNGENMPKGCQMLLLHLKYHVPITSL